MTSQSDTRRQLDEAGWGDYSMFREDWDALDVIVDSALVERDRYREALDLVRLYNQSIESRDDPTTATMRRIAREALGA